MKKGYWIARVDITDPETYKSYIAANGPVFAKFAARFIVRAGRCETLEGTSRQRNVVIEFPSYADAARLLAFARIPGGQEAARRCRDLRPDRH